MAITFHKQEGCNFMPAGRTKIRVWIGECIKREGYRAGDIAYVFCGSDEHRKMNVDYLGHDYNTDVITFDYSDLETKKIVSGDIFIDPATVREYAAEWKTKPNEEIMRVMIHGVLHLCGYSDKTPDEQNIMRAKENDALTFYVEQLGDYPEWE